MAFHVMVLCGGSGTRLWPLSRELMPKQFAPLIRDRGLYEITLERAAELKPESIIVVTAESQEKICRGIAFDKCPLHIKAEPIQRNTLPAIVYGAAGLADEDVILMMPSDHLIGDTKALTQAAQAAVALADEGHIVTFGITPTHPATGYGYIQEGKPLSEAGRAVARFVEKPAEEKAKQMLAEGGYYWNSGMFCFRVGDLKADVAKFEPAVSSLFDVRGPVSKSTYEQIPSQSFDYGIAEVSDRMAVIPVNYHWNDLGSWQALWEELNEGDQQICTSPGVSLINEDSERLLVYSDRPEDKQFAAIGLRDIAIIDTTDALLVTDLANCQKVKAVHTKVREQRPDAATRPTKEYRPWGSFEILQERDGYKVKRLDVKPGFRLSLQSHQHRNEHWVVVSGKATVVNGDQELVLVTGESTYIPAGNKHRLANLGDAPLAVIEVQTGDYLGEDDIRRFQDDFGR